MRLFSRLFLALSAFLLVSLIIYFWHAREYEGVVLSITVALGALLIGGWGSSVVRRSAQEAAQPAAEPDVPPRPAQMDEVDEPHVGPTIWPLVFAISAVGIVVGLVGNRWVLVAGGALFVAAAIGWVVDVHHQWHHHFGSHGDAAEHGDTAGHAAAEAAADRPAAVVDEAEPAAVPRQAEAAHAGEPAGDRTDNQADHAT